MNEQLEFVKQIASRRDSAGIAYMLTGSMALAIYALPRMTRDIDLVIECRPEDSEELVKLFEADCYVDAESIRDAVVGRAMFNIIHKEWMIRAPSSNDGMSGPLWNRLMIWIGVTWKFGREIWGFGTYWSS